MKIMRNRKVNWIVFAFGFIGMFMFSSPAYCLCAQPWYEGWWNCRIDDRPSTIVWEMEVTSETTCNGNTCSTVNDVCKVHGWIKEANGNWVYLKRNDTNSNEVFFTFTGDNTPWYLQRFRASTTEMSGHTKWNGRHYPLTCTRM